MVHALPLVFKLPASGGSVVVPDGLNSHLAFSLAVFKLSAGILFWSQRGPPRVLLSDTHLDRLTRGPNILGENLLLTQSLKKRITGP